MYIYIRYRTFKDSGSAKIIINGMDTKGVELSVSSTRGKTKERNE